MRKKENFKFCLIFIITLFFNNIQAQNKVFKYDFEYKPNYLKDSTILEKTILDIKDGNLSIFRTEQEKKSDSLKVLTGLGLGRKLRFEDQFYIIKNLNENKIYKSIQTIYKDIFSIDIKEKLNWEILPEKMIIGNFSAQKAKVNYGSRNWTAWFTTEVPIHDGPYIFNGLPGLIIKISDDQNNYIFNLTEIKNGGEKIYYRNKGLELTWDQFQKISMNYYSDPLAQIKSSRAPYKVDDGAGNMISVNMKLESDRLKKIIREDNNPIELNYKVDYK